MKPSARPRSLKEIFGRNWEGLQKPRLHSPRQRVSNRKEHSVLRKGGSSLGSIQKTFQDHQQLSEASIDQPNNIYTKLASIVTLKPITKPLLQKLFKKSSTPAAGQAALKDPNILSSFDQIRSRISEGRRLNRQKGNKAVLETGNEGIANEESLRSALSESQILTEQQRLSQQILEQQKQEQPELEEIEENKKKEKLLMDALVQLRVKE